MSTNPNEGQSFLDPKTLLAIVLSGVLFIGWNSYLKSKYPQPEKEQVTQAPVDDPKAAQENIANGSIPDSTKVKTLQETTPTALNGKISQEQLYKYEDANWSFDISSKGMGIKNLKLNKYFDREKNPKKIGGENGLLPFATTLSGRSTPLEFNISRVGETGFVGTSKVGNLTVTKSVEINSDNYTFDTKISVLGRDENFIGVKTFMAEPLRETSGGGFLDMNRFDIQEFFISYDSSEDREIINIEEPQNKSYSSVSSVSVGEQYFAQAIVDKSDILPDAKTRVDTKEGMAVASLDYPFVNRNQDFNISYVAYMGPKSFSLLDNINSSLSSIIDFGIFGFLARPILSLLHILFDVVGNWGIAIVILTIIVRIIVLPLHMSSYKSMKNMSKMSPLIKELNEKYKDDREMKNQKMMEIYKENKINPLGGCLPMLLQLPVFFALYQVLGQSIELYQAPFIFWIEDLSMKDPYYVLPVLMGITMFFQMRITPSTMDETQKKVMMFMPIMFSFFMISLPSGLTLYIFISGLFGIIQQYAMKDRTTVDASK